MIGHLFSAFVILVGTAMVFFAALIPFAIASSIVDRTAGHEESKIPLKAGLYIAGFLGIVGGCVIHEMFLHHAELSQKLLIRELCNAGLGIIFGCLAGVILCEAINSAMRKTSAWIESRFETKKPFRQKLFDVEWVVIIFLCVCFACTYTVGMK